MPIPGLILKAQDFNLVLQNQELFQTFYSLTLYRGNLTSGLTYEMKNLSRIGQNRKVKAKVIWAEKDDKIVGWALLSREPSDFFSSENGYWFDPNRDGVLFEVFVAKQYRKQGIGTELIKLARRKSYPYNLCFVSWDTASKAFYNNFKHYKHKSLGNI